MELKTMDWPKLTPVVTWLMNSQVNPKTGFSPQELFLGRPSCRPEIVIEPDLTPSLENFLREQILLQEKIQERL